MAKSRARKNAAPTSEVAITRYLDEGRWQIETNDKREADAWKRRGYKPTPATARGPWWVFLVPLTAITFRKAELAERMEANQKRVK
jgi:hypothetical protein